MLWKQAQTAFNAGDYPTAETALKTAISKSSAFAATWLDGQTTVKVAPPNQQWLEPYFFMLGASYFNAKDWPNAINTFATYLKLFPLSTRATQVTFSLAQSNLLGGQPDAAVPLFTSLLPLPAYHVKAFLLLVESYQRAGKADQAVTLMEKERTQPNLNPIFLQKINMKLLPLYVASGSLDKAGVLLQQLDEDIAHVQDVTAFNTLAVKLGDQLLSKNNIPGALDCYRRVRDNSQIFDLEKQQIATLQQQRAKNLAIIQADPLNSSQLQLDNGDIDTQIAKDQQVLVQYQTLPPVQPPLFLRIARAYASGGSFWESAVVYREILRRYPTCAEAEGALYGSIILFDRLKQIDRAEGLCQAYVKQYPKGKYTNDVGFLRGALAYDDEDFDKAVANFQESLKNQPDNPRREQIELILGDIKLRELKFDEAEAAYQKYQKDYPQGRFFEASVYRNALALLLGSNAAGNYDAADAAFHDYLQKYPAVAAAPSADTSAFGTSNAPAQGHYIPDTEYRLAMIAFGRKQYDQAIQDCIAWEKKHGGVPPSAEVLSLEGDCYTSLDQNDLAVDAYIRSYKALLAYKDKAAQSNEVLNYSIFTAAKILQKQAKWDDIVKMFMEFIKNNPDHPTVVGAVSWVGRADVKLGKVEEAKQFMAATAKKYLDDPSREGVDEIITQLAQLYAHKHFSPTPVSAPAATPTVSLAADKSAPPIASDLSAATPAADALAPVSPTADSDPAKDLEDVLMIPDLDTKPTARSRILFAKAELARIQRRLDLEKQYLEEIAKEFSPEDLSPDVLGQVGDRLVQDGQPTQAIPFYNQLMDAYDTSAVVDFAYNGVAGIAYSQKDYLRADKFYSKALSKGLAVSKLKDITLGEAQTLLLLNRPAEAKPLFEQVASTRAWRGEVTALSVYSLGEVQMALGQDAATHGKLQDAQNFYAAAIAYYQRVFVAYQRYSAVVAKAYLRSGEAFENMGKIPEAVRTYKEMTDLDKNPNLAPFPETVEGKQRLASLSSK